MNLQEPPEVVYFVTTKPTTNRDRRTLPHHRFYSLWQHVVMFWNHHPTRERKVYKGTVSWEEVDVGTLIRDAERTSASE